jgi:hypothetical protein
MANDDGAVRVRRPRFRRSSAFKLSRRTILEIRSATKPSTSPSILPLISRPFVVSRIYCPFHPKMLASRLFCILRC